LYAGASTLGGDELDQLAYARGAVSGEVVTVTDWF